VQRQDTNMQARATQCQAARFQTQFEPNKYSNRSKPISNSFKLSSIQQDLPGVQKFEIKYGWREFEIGNNFDYKCFLIFEMDVELKFRDASMT
jgi:hypothetical protein